MKIEKAGHQLLTDISYSLMPQEVGIPGVSYSVYEAGAYELKQIERIARVCYKSEDKISEGTESAKKLISNLIRNGHEAMLEHGSLSVLFKCDRAVSHELVRHRMDYSKDKFDGNVTFIQPWWMDEEDDIGYSVWKQSCLQAEKAYFDLLNMGYLPQQARGVLPNCTKTEIVVTANYREWRHILKLRCAKDAHPDMRHMMTDLLKELQSKLPVIFDDIKGE